MFAFFSKEKATKKPIVSFDMVYQRTSKALGVSYTAVHRIMNGKGPCKSNRPKERAKILDDFDHWRGSVFDIYFTEFGAALTTALPILFQCCYRYCDSDSRNLWAVMKAEGLAL